MQSTRKVLIRNFAFGFGVIAAGIGAQAYAADYYVDQNNAAASDSNPGTAEQPWATLGHAAKAALQPGDTVYVKAGTYKVSGGAWNVPSINPARSGAPGKPITFKSLPAHAAVIHGDRKNPPIGVYGRKHIVIDGFTVTNVGSKGMAVFGQRGAYAQDVVIQNNVIHGVSTGGGDNADGVRLEYARDVVVRNNKIYNVKNAQGSSNASAIKTYFTDNALIEHNQLFDAPAGVKEKEGSKRMVVRNNYMYGCSTGFVLNNQNSAMTEDIRFYQNVVLCSSGVTASTQASAGLREVRIYNNTFSGYTSKAIHGTEHGQSMYIYNNIFHRYSTSVEQADFFTRRNDTGEIKLMDHNLWFSGPKIVVGIYGARKNYTTLEDWKASGHGLSQHDVNGEPQFLNPAVGDYRVAPTSPAAGLGRVDGNGAAVNAGAYPTGNEVVGLLGQPAAAPAPAAPAPTAPPAGQFQVPGQVQVPAPAPVPVTPPSVVEKIKSLRGGEFNLIFP